MSLHVADYHLPGGYQEETGAAPQIPVLCVVVALEAVKGREDDAVRGVGRQVPFVHLRELRGREWVWGAVDAGAAW